MYSAGGRWAGGDEGLNNKGDSERISHACFQVSAYWIQTESTVLAINFSPRHVAHFPDVPATLQRLHGVAGQEASPASSGILDLCNSG